MAFSMFLRNSACTSRIFSQQVMRLATQPAFTQRVAVAVVPLKNVGLTQANSTPILNAVRSFRTTAPTLAEHGHDHSKLWVVEKAVTAAMVPLMPLALLMPNKLFDSLLAILITAHSFWGMESLVVEYCRVLVVGPVVPKIAMGAVYFLTAITLGGLFYINFNDIGITRAFWKIWRNMRSTGAPPRGGQATVRGLEAIAVDYVRASIFGPLIPKLAIALVYLVSIATLGGLFYIISHDVGICNAIRQLWSIKAKEGN